MDVRPWRGLGFKAKIFGLSFDLEAKALGLAARGLGLLHCVLVNITDKHLNF